MTAKWRVVFDTNVVVSALVFEGRIAVALRGAWLANHIPLGSADTIGELQEVLRYRKFKLSASDVEELLGDYLPHVEIVEVSVTSPLQCRDPRDQKFLDLAHCAEADALVTGDGDLLALAAHAKFQILTPAEFLAA